MPLFPNVTSPCPYKAKLATVMDGDHCRVCKRQVFDLNAMTDGGRRAFLSGCDGAEICVSYRLPAAAAIAAAALAAATPAMAQEPVAPPAQAELEADLDVGEMMIIVGGIRNPSEAELTVGTDDTAASELPVAFEDDATASEPAEGVDANRKI